VLAIVVALIMPAVMARTNLLKRRDVYPTIAMKYGPFPYIEQKIFEEKSDVDMVFMGSSHIWNAINTPYVQQKVSEKLGRKAEVFSLDWPWGGFDALYVVAHDLLEHRHVRVLVFYDEDRGLDTPHPHSSRWFRIGENSEALDGLPVIQKAALYGGAVLGMPRHLLSLVRPNLMEDPENCRTNFFNTYYHAPNLARNFGALRAKLGFNVSPIFTEYEPKTSATPADAIVYSDATKDQFTFTGIPTQPYQLHFVRLLAELCRQKGTHLIVLHPPNFAERGQSTITERVNWSQELGVPVDILGIVPTKLFSGLSEADGEKLFYENEHMNQNGQNYFTRLITPKLIEIYENANQHH
jgi:hypothetical protein